MIRRWLSVAVLIAGALLFTAPTSQAIGPCPDATAPAPASPDGGVLTSLFVTPPPSLPPANANPFGDRPTASVYDVYGFGGTEFHTYQGGCIPHVFDDLGTFLGNIIFQFGPEWIVAGVVALQHLAFNPTFLAVFNPFLIQATNAIRTALYDQWILVFLALGGVLILVKAHKGNVSKAATAAAWSLLVMFVVAAIFAWPVQAGSLADRIVPATVGQVADGINHINRNGTDPSASTAGLLQRTILYDNWVRGTFGNTDSPAVQQLAPKIFDGQAYTWREQATVNAALRKAAGCGGDKLCENAAVAPVIALLAVKNKEWTDAATQLKTEDPQAYDSLIGNSPSNRIGGALIGLIEAVVSLPLLVAACLLLLGCYLIFRVAVVIAPALATFGVMAPMSGVMLGIANVLVAVVINCVVAGVAALLNLLFLQVVLSPRTGLPLWGAVVLAGLFSFVMWKVMHPFRRLTQTVSSQNLFKNAVDSPGDAADRTWKRTKKVAGVVGAAAATGGVAALSVEEALKGADSAPRHRAETDTRPEPATVPDVPTHEPAHEEGLPRPVEPPTGPELPVGTPPTVPPRTLPPAPDEPPSARPQPATGDPTPRTVPDTPQPVREPWLEEHPQAETHPAMADDDLVYDIYNPDDAEAMS